MYYLFPEDYPRLSIYCLTHDIGEGWMGDVPAPALWAVEGVQQIWGYLENDLIELAGCPRVDELSPEDLKKLKACDRLELYIWCKEQLLIGNQYVLDCIKALDESFLANELPYPAYTFYRELKNAKDFQFLPEQQGIVKRLTDVNK
jgi:5'-deoxynucleotidase YfbR-like HD superfamily hydrolase